MTKLNIDNFIKSVNAEIIKDQREALKAVEKIEKRKEAKYELIVFDLRLIRSRLKKLRQFEKDLSKEIKTLENNLKRSQIKKQTDIKNKQSTNKKINCLIQIIKQTKKKILSLNKDIEKLNKQIEQANKQETEIKSKKTETFEFMKKLRQVISKKISQEKLLMIEIKKLEKEEARLKKIEL